MVEIKIGTLGFARHILRRQRKQHWYLFRRDMRPKFRGIKATKLGIEARASDSFEFKVAIHSTANSNKQG